MIENTERGRKIKRESGTFIAPVWGWLLLWRGQMTLHSHRVSWHVLGFYVLGLKISCTFQSPESSESSLWAIPAKVTPSPLALPQKSQPSLSLEALQYYSSTYTTSLRVIVNQGLSKYSSPSAEPKAAVNNSWRVKFMWGKKLMLDKSRFIKYLQINIIHLWLLQLRNFYETETSMKLYREIRSKFGLTHLLTMGQHLLIQISRN